MGRKVPNIYAGNTVKKRDRQSFKNFVLEVIEDTFINEFTPTSSSLDSDTQTLFTLFLGPKDGNSDGDFAMMVYTDAHKKYKTFQLYVHHTDDVREVAYDRKSHIGRLDKGLDYAKKNDWSYQ